MTQQIKTALVLGAGGFIGSHMVKRLKIQIIQKQKQMSLFYLILLIRF
jgi:nucleoside-diphosphate-sugar epimerase